MITSDKKKELASSIKLLNGKNLFQPISSTISLLETKFNNIESVLKAQLLMDRFEHKETARIQKEINAETLGKDTSLVQQSTDTSMLSSILDSVTKQVSILSQALLNLTNSGIPGVGTAGKSIWGKVLGAVGLGVAAYTAYEYFSDSDEDEQESKPIKPKQKVSEPKLDKPIAKTQVHTNVKPYEYNPKTKSYVPSKPTTRNTKVSSPVATIKHTNSSRVQATKPNTVKLKPAAPIQSQKPSMWSNIFKTGGAISVGAAIGAKVGKSVVESVSDSISTGAEAAGMAATAVPANYSLANQIGANSQEWDIYRNTVAFIESKGKYGITGGSGKHYDGRYQMGADAKADAARILKIRLPHDSSSRAKFRSDPNLQESAFAAFTLANHKTLMKNKKYASANIERKLQILGYAHNQGAGGAINWINTGQVGRDGFGTRGDAYTNAIAANFRNKGSYVAGQEVGNAAKSGVTAAIGSGNPIAVGLALGNQIANTVSGMFFKPVNGRITSKFGIRTDPVTGQKGRFHGGLDLAAPNGTPVKSTKPGIVSIAGPAGNYGNLVEVNHGNGLTSRYAHLSSIKVRVGQKVDVGQLLGGVGSTGKSTGNHLHFEIRKNGIRQDPQQFINGSATETNPIKSANATEPGVAPVGNKTKTGSNLQTQSVDVKNKKAQQRAQLWINSKPSTSQYLIISTNGSSGRTKTKSSGSTRRFKNYFS